MALLYYLVLLPISILPTRALYLLADVLSFVLYRIVKYRRALVEKNLALCFPDKDASWVKEQTLAFYANLGDVVVESIQAFSMNKKDAEKRIFIENPEVLQERFDQGRSVIITGGHYVSWESMTQVGYRIPHKVLALYKPLKNTFMDAKVRSSRERFETSMIPMKTFRPYFDDLKTEPKAFIFGIDQSPRKGKGIWIDFLNRETLIFTGPERLSKEYNVDIVAGRMKRLARGQYSVKFELLYDKPHETPEGEISTRTMKDVEAQVIEAPSGWLWSHNRWKHTRDDGY